MIGYLRTGIHAAGALAALVLTIGFAISPWSIGIVIVIAATLVWFIGLGRKWRWAPTTGLVSLVGAAAFGVWRGMPAAWMLVAVVAALLAWDLSGFAQRLASAGNSPGQEELIRAHVRRILTVAGVGLALGEIAIGVRLEFSFSWALLLTLLAVWGLSRAILFLRRESDL